MSATTTPRTPKNFTAQTITQQLAQRSGQIAIQQTEGGTQFIDQSTGNVISGPSATSVLLAIPPKSTDPKLTAHALNLVRGAYSSPGTPKELIEAIASVAAYVSATQGIPITSLISNNSVSLELIQAYNAFKPKGSQLGIVQLNTKPAWANNPTLRGSIALALEGQV